MRVALGSAQIQPPPFIVITLPYFAADKQDQEAEMKLLQFLLAATLLAAPSLSAASMRCGKQLVLEGYDFDQVQQICGEADATYSLGDKYLYRSVGNRVEQATIAEVVKVDKWVYRGDERRFTRNLYFENGVLVKIELGGR